MQRVLREPRLLLSQQQLVVRYPNTSHDGLSLAPYRLLLEALEAGGRTQRSAGERAECREAAVARLGKGHDVITPHPAPICIGDPYG